MKFAIDHLKNYLPHDLSNDEISKSLMQLGHENDLENNIIDIEITPNRGDCLSLKGIIRDLGSLHEVSWTEKIFEKDIHKLNLKFKNNAENDCPFISFLKIEVEDLPTKYEPYLENYFKDLNIKKNNFFTDVSNYVSYEIGNPTHCYDFFKVGEAFELCRTSGINNFETLTNKKVELQKDELVFIKDSKVINLAGIMGGSSTSCSKNTKTVLVECAYFSPESIIGRSIKYDLNSDAAYKFERGVDPLNLEKCLRRFIKIVEDHCTLKNVEIFSTNSKLYKETKLENNIDRVNSVIGINFSKNEYEKILKRLGFRIKSKIIVPSHRSDIQGSNDVAEELARVVGYDNIPRIEFKLKPLVKDLYISSQENKLRAYLAGNGFNEVINFPFTQKNDESSIIVDNPLDSNKKSIRTSLTDSLIENLSYNERRQKDSIKIFEISNVYSDGEYLQEAKHACLVVGGRKGENFVDFNTFLDTYYLEKLLLDIGIKDFEINKISREVVDSKNKYDIFSAEFNIDEKLGSIKKFDINDFLRFEDTKYKEVSEFPSTIRDISIMATSEKQIGPILDAVGSIEENLIKNKFIFDYYENKKNNHTKIGYRFIFQSNKKTLTVEEVDKVMADIVKSILSIEGVSIPGI